jgi:hypothetical protein
MSLTVTILVVLLCAYVFLWLLILWIGERIGRRWSAFDTGRAEAVLRASNRIAVHQTSGPLIQMPDKLKTRDEMVGWMTTEFPRLTAEKMRVVKRNIIC